MPGKRSDRLLPGGEQNPAVEMEPAADLEYHVHRSVLVAKAGHSHGVGRVSGVRRDRALVVDHAHRQAAPPEAADDPETLVVTSNDDGADAVGAVHAAGSRAA